MPRRILHLVGSAVSDLYCDLSRLYAADCLASLAADRRYEHHLAYVTPDRRWRFPTDLGAEAIASASPLALPEAVQVVAGLGVEVMVPQMFCGPGMTTYRALFDLLGIPYLGNRPEVMAATGNKAIAKAIVAGAGVRVPEGQVVRRGQRPSVAPPAVVKPVDADNSLGVALVRHAGQYDAALDAAFAHADAVLVEPFIELGREVRCGIVERRGDLVCLPLEEYALDRDAKPIRDYDDKLRRAEGGDLTLVAKDGVRAWMVDPSDPLTQRVWEEARRCHAALGCRHYSLFDFRIDPQGDPWFLEAGLYCSFARQSVISMMAESAGIGLGELFDTVMAEATS